MAAGRYGDLRIRSGSRLRARGSLNITGFLIPIWSIMCPYCLLTSSHPRRAGE